MKILAERSFLAKFAIKEGHKMEERAIMTGKFIECSTMCMTLANHFGVVTWIEFHPGPVVHPQSASIF